MTILPVLSLLFALLPADTVRVAGIGLPLVQIPETTIRMGATEVTNAQYEAYDPSHVRAFSTGDDDAVTMVSWDDAAGFCRWLSARTGRTFRLPTEAEWENACRAGTGTAFNTGDSFPESQEKAQGNNREKVPVPLRVAQFPPNAWGLYDMHGNVEEWCLDAWDDDAGFRVTRGGSHNVELPYLRSDARAAALPEDRSVLRGFRIVEVLPATMLCRPEPVFLAPQPYILPPDDPSTPFFPHNHQPAVTVTRGGDLLAVWYSCRAEAGREMVVLQSRCHDGQWSPARLFFRVPERNVTGTALLTLPDGTLLHFNGVSDAGEWRDLAIILRRSDDDGRSWSRPRLIAPAHTIRHQVIAGPVVTGDGRILLCCDAGPGGEDGTALHISRDGGQTWEDTGSTIAGIHAGIVERADGTLLALGRGNAVEGKMPCSRSTDGGRTWAVTASPFPPIGSGQRLVLRRLAEGPILLCSFDENGLFAALSYDEGETWPVRRHLTDGAVRTMDGGAWTGSFTMDAVHAEPKGYLACTQSPDGIIHLLSSRLHYRFNLRWIEASKE